MISKESFDPLDWAINCAAISQYYVGLGEFGTAAHCLVCASKVADSGGKETEEQQEQHANLARCWLK